MTDILSDKYNGNDSAIWVNLISSYDIMKHHMES